MIFALGLSMLWDAWLKGKNGKLMEAAYVRCASATCNSNSPTNSCCKLQPAMSVMACTVHSYSQTSLHALGFQPRVHQQPLTLYDPM